MLHSTIFWFTSKQFSSWLNSCKYNSTIDWIVFTDDIREFVYPNNVMVRYMTFEEFQEIYKIKYDFEISLNSPQKICDYKVTYGEVFQEYLSEYDFWGYCDVDLVFGDIRHFITDSHLNYFPKLLGRGHFTLFKNNADLNSLYRSEYNGSKRYKEVFSSDQILAFDEYGGDKIGINDLAKANRIPIYEDIIFDDIEYSKYKFVCAQLEKEHSLFKNIIYLWNKGKLYRYFLVGDKVDFQETMYIHYQKRNIKNLDITTSTERFIIYPNRMKEFKSDINKKTLIEYGSNNNFYLELILKKIKRKLNIFAH